MYSSDITSVDSQPSSKQNPSPGNQDINISNASPEVQRRVLAMMSEFSDSDEACDVHLIPTNKNTVTPETQADSINNSAYSGFVDKTSSNANGEANAAMELETNVEGDVGNSSGTVFYRTNMYETPTQEGEPSRDRDGSGSGQDEPGSTGGNIPFKRIDPERSGRP